MEIENRRTREEKIEEKIEEEKIEEENKKKKLMAPPSLVRKRRRLRQDVIDDAKRTNVPLPEKMSSWEKDQATLKALLKLNKSIDALMEHEEKHNDKYEDLIFPAIECP